MGCGVAGMDGNVSSRVEVTVYDNKTHEKAARGMLVSARLAFVDVAAAGVSAAKVSGIHWEKRSADESAW